MPCEPELAPLEPDEPLLSFAGPFLLPGSPFTPAPELGEVLGSAPEVVDESAAIAGARPSNVAAAQAAKIFFMTFPSFFIFTCGGNTHPLIPAFRRRR